MQEYVPGKSSPSLSYAFHSFRNKRAVDITLPFDIRSGPTSYVASHSELRTDLQVKGNAERAEAVEIQIQQERAASEWEHHFICGLNTVLNIC